VKVFSWQRYNSTLPETRVKFNAEQLETSRRAALPLRANASFSNVA
jgi:hypothetical protein